MGNIASVPPTIRPFGLWLHLGIGVGVGLAVGAGLLATSAPVYASTISVLVGGEEDDVNMRTEAELVRATETATDAFARLTQDPAQPPVLGRLVSVEPIPGTLVLVIRFEAGAAMTAQAGATAFAEAYLDARGAAAQAALDSQIIAVQQRLDEVRAELGGVTALVDALPPDSAELGSLRAAQESLTTEAGSLTARLHELRTTLIDPGRIVAEAPLPTAPVRPNRPLVLGIGAAGGVLAGLLLHLMRTRWSRRVHRVADLRRHNLAVLAEGATDVDRRYDRLRNEVMAALGPSDRVILVSGAAPGPAGMVVAANLAAAFARAGSDVVLVGASVPQHGTTLASLFDVADVPGLTDVLAGRTTLPRAIQRAGRHPRLRVVTPGGTGSAGGLLQSAGARSVLGQLATRNQYVIVDAPSTGSGADAQSLASASDAALLVVELGQTRHAQVADAVTQLARVGTPVLGAVALPRLTAVDPPPAAPGPPPIQTEAWIGGRSAALDGPTRTLDRLNRGRSLRGAFAGIARAPEAPSSPSRPDDAADRTSTTSDREGSERTAPATGRGGPPPAASTP